MKFQKPYGLLKIVLYDESVIIHLASFKFHNIWEGVSGMAKPELSRKTKTEIEDSSSLKGTLASVFLLGFILVVTWVSVYFLFLDRF